MLGHKLVAWSRAPGPRSTWQKWQLGSGVHLQRGWWLVYFYRQNLGPSDEPRDTGFQTSATQKKYSHLGLHSNCHKWNPAHAEAQRTWYLSWDQNAEHYSEAEGQVDSQEASMSTSAEHDLRNGATAKQLGGEEGIEITLCFTSGPVTDQCLHLLLSHLHALPQPTHDSKGLKLQPLVKGSRHYL